MYGFKVLIRCALALERRTTDLLFSGVWALLRMLAIILTTHQSAHKKCVYPR